MSVQIPDGLMKDSLKCGGCGGDRFKISNLRKPNADSAGGGGCVDAIHANTESDENRHAIVAGCLIVTCLKCNKESVVSISVPSITISGNLCGGWGL